MSDKTTSAGEADVKKELARFILEQLKEQRLDKARALSFIKELSGQAAGTHDDIAIIGIACRFPQADSKEEFWENLVAGRNSIRPFPAERRADLAAIDDNKTDLFKGGFLSSVDQFDNEYFRIPPNLARHMDPYQRLLMETLVEAVEDAGYHRGAIYGKPIGIFAGNDHTHRLFNCYLDFIDQPDFNSITGSWTAVLASRLSYLFNLKGPTAVVDTACSSGLVALDYAIKALRAGDCESALVGAANIFFAPGKGIVGEIENEDFQVRAFDSRASGTVWGEGVAAIMVKPLAHALRDGDPVHAVIKGIAVNNDGASNGLTAPNAKAQQEVILKAWERARIDPSEITYIETHGTGTHLGDPIEIKGLLGAFERHSARRQFCGIGSVKTNIGHTVGVAGLASLIKVVMSLKHNVVPPSINFDQPNPFIDFCNSPVYVNDRVQAWPAGDKPRLAGVSSFSLSGANCHLVIQDAPAQPRREAERAPRLFPLSARDRTLFAATLRRYIRHLREHPELNLADASFTAATGREHHSVRAAIVADSMEELCRKLVYLLETVESCADRWMEEGLSFQVADAVDEAIADRQSRDEALKQARGGDVHALHALARLYVNGAAIKWEELYREEKRRRVSLPPQPFARKRFWDKTRRAVSAGRESAATDAAPATRQEEEISRERLLACVREEPSRISDAGDAALPHRVAAYLWTEVLGYRQIRLTQDFTSLGGDSITGIKIVHLFDALFGIRLNVTDLLGASSLDDFVARLNDKYGFAGRLACEEGENRREPSAAAILPAPHADAYPLSRAQRRMFLLERMNPGLPAYNVNAVVRLDALPDLAETEEVVRQLVARHEILRTGFELRGEELVQIVYDDAPFRVEHVRLAPEAPAEARHAALHQAASAFVRPFDLARPPLMRIGFLECGDECHMVIDMHHIVTDGSSMGVLIGEFLALQAGTRLAPLPFQYKDFAAWQNRLFEQGAYLGHKEYWLSRFKDGVPALDLQADFPRPAYQDFRGARHSLLIGAALSSRLQQLARREGATLFMVLLAAFDTLLYRFGGGSDLVVGTPVAGRSRHELHALIGMFVNTLALRHRIEPGDSFSGFLARVKADTLSALDHQDYPYEELVEALKLPRDGGRNPMFDVYFALQNEDMGLSHGGGVEVVPFDSGTAKFDMTVVARPSSEGIHIDWEYASSLYKAGTIARMAQAFLEVLQAVADNPETGLDDIDLLSPEQHALLKAMNETLTPYPSDRGLAQLFEEQAARRPDAVALEMDGARQTYAELNRRANRLAHRLVRQGVRPEIHIGLLFDRSFAMIEAMLAVLKAGCAYVPLDIDNPAGRNRDILEEAHATVLLAGSGLEPPEIPGLAVIHPENESLDELPESNLDVETTGESLAYVLFTSGSTGRPKGTLILQKGVVRLVRDTNYITLLPSDRVLQLSNYAFDGSVFDIWAALLNGGRLVLVSRRELLDMDALANIIREREISVCLITTALFNVLVDLKLEYLSGVRHVLFGGEAASNRHVARAFEALGPGRLINAYGPTEATVIATAYPIHALGADDITVPIGRPISNTTVYVLDEHLKPVPVGVAGELYVGGDGVARGYLERDELTRECFLPDPFQPGRTMYRSGDLVKWDEHGAIHFLGRRDHQVKIRGFRIELGEIETAISRHPNVKECLVCANPDEQGRKQLCAYVVPSHYNESSNALFAQELRAYLGTSLPDYMIPAAVVVLPAFPLNANGKIDRKSLPAPQPLRNEIVAARDEREALLAQIWRELLDLRDVGIHDNFFALGGDSIKAIQVIARLQAGGYSAQMPLFFQHQTIAELAPRLDRIEGTAAEQGIVTGDFPLNPIQSWFLQSQPEEAHHFNHAMYVALSDMPDTGHVRRAASALCTHHDALRAVFRRNGDAWEARLRAPSGTMFRLFEFEAESLSSNDERNQSGLMQVQTALDIENGPLMAIGLFKSGKRAGLCIAVHHLVVDVVSWSALLADFQRCLDDIARGAVPQLPPKTASVAAWNNALLDYAGSPQAAASLGHWKALARLSAGTICDRAAAAGTLADGRFETLRIDPDTSAQLMGDANLAYTSEPQHLLLAALGRALKAWHGQDHSLVMLESHGREGSRGMPDASRTVGWFTAAFPFALSDGEEAGALIKATKEALRNLPGKGLDYGVLRYLADLSAEDRVALESLAPQVGFNFLGKVDGGTDVQALGRHLTSSPRTRLDLAMDIVACIRGGCLELELLYDGLRLEERRVRAFLETFVTVLKALVGECCEVQTTEKTASDFTVTKIDQDELDDILSDLDIV